MIFICIGYVHPAHAPLNSSNGCLNYVSFALGIIDVDSISSTFFIFLGNTSIPRSFGSDVANFQLMSSSSASVSPNGRSLRHFFGHSLTQRPQPRQSRGDTYILNNHCFVLSSSSFFGAPLSPIPMNVSGEESVTLSKMNGRIAA